MWFGWSFSPKNTNLTDDTCLYMTIIKRKISCTHAHVQDDSRSSFYSWYTEPKGKQYTCILLPAQAKANPVNSRATHIMICRCLALRISTDRRGFIFHGSQSTIKTANNNSPQKIPAIIWYVHVHVCHNVHNLYACMHMYGVDKSDLYYSTYLDKDDWEWSEHHLKKLKTEG